MNQLELGLTAKKVLGREEWWACVAVMSVSLEGRAGSRTGPWEETNMVSGQLGRSEKGHQIIGQQDDIAWVTVSREPTGL